MRPPPRTSRGDAARPVSEKARELRPVAVGPDLAIPGAVGAREDQKMFRTQRRLRGAMLGIGILTAALAVPSAPAEAHGKHHRHAHQGHHAKQHHYRDHHYRNHHYQRHGHVAHRYRGHGGYVRASFRVPQRIVYRSFDHYAPYYRGRHYYRPHGHVHAVYHFPVYDDHGYELRRFDYCGGELFVPAPAARGRVDVSLRF